MTHTISDGATSATLTYDSEHARIIQVGFTDDQCDASVSPGCRDTVLNGETPMRMISNVLILICAISIVSGCATAGTVGCASTRDVSDNLRLVAAQSNTRAGLELIGNISDCLRERADAGTMGDIDDAVIDQLIGLLNNDDDGIRGGAALSLGRFGPRAKRAIPALDRAYIRIEKELSKRFVAPASASDAEIVAALERITGKSGDELELPPIPNDVN